MKALSIVSFIQALLIFVLMLGLDFDFLRIIGISPVFFSFLAIVFFLIRVLAYQRISFLLATDMFSIFIFVICSTLHFGLLAREWHDESIYQFFLGPLYLAFSLLRDGETGIAFSPLFFIFAFLSVWYVVFVSYLCLQLREFLQNFRTLEDA